MRSFIGIVIDAALMKEFVFIDFLQIIAKKHPLEPLKNTCVVLLSDLKKEVTEGFAQKISRILKVDVGFLYANGATLKEIFSSYDTSIGSDTLYITKNKILAEEAASLGCEILHFQIDLFNGLGRLYEPHLQKFHAKKGMIKENAQRKRQCLLALDIDETTLFYDLSIKNEKTVLNPAIVSLLNEVMHDPSLDLKIYFITARKSEGSELTVVHHKAVLAELYEAVKGHPLLHPEAATVYFDKRKFERLKMLSNENPEALCVLVDDNPSWTRPFEVADCPENMMYIWVHSFFLNDDNKWEPTIELEVFRNWYDENKEKINTVSVNQAAFFSASKSVSKSSLTTRCCTIM